MTIISNNDEFEKKKALEGVLDLQPPKYGEKATSKGGYLCCFTLKKNFGAGFI